MVVTSQNNSVEESKALGELRFLVSDLKQDEATCLRFLRARNHDKAKAEEMLRKSLQWRSANNVDDWKNWVIPKEVQDGFPYSYSGKDLKGQAVIYLPVGSWETRKFIESGWKDELERNVFVVLETIDKVRRESTQEQFYCIVDLAGLTWNKWAHYETIQITLKVFRYFEANYPETLNKAVVINAPWIFSSIFPVLKPLMSGHTLSKINVHDSNVIKWRAALLEDMEADSLPHSCCPV